MNTIKLRPLAFSKELAIQCNICRTIVAQGSVIIIALDPQRGQKIMGLVPETSVICCGRRAEAPKLLLNLKAAEEFIHEYAEEMKGQNEISLSPAEPDLDLLLREFGSSLEQAQELVSKVVDIETGKNN